MVKSTTTSADFVREIITEASDSASASVSGKYKGVRKRKWGKFVSEIRLPNSRERIWLGSYDTAEKAARAFDAALFCLRGSKNVKFNFPENPPEITNGMTMTPGEIQEAAARYAHSGEQGPRVENSDVQSSMPCSHAESPCPSVSYEFANMPLDNAFSDQFLGLGHENNFGAFPGYGDYYGEFFAPPLPDVDSWPEYTEEMSSQSSFLWNF